MSLGGARCWGTKLRRKINRIGDNASITALFLQKSLDVDSLRQNKEI